MKNKILTICIPTYNRMNELERLLFILRNEILKSLYKNNIEILIANNASSDGTNNIIKKYMNFFSQDEIACQFIQQKYNKGFDGNVMDLYKMAESEYVWWFSDDDLLLENQIDLIIDDLNKYSPTVCLSNFAQPPHDIANPVYVSNTSFYENELTIGTKFIIKYPKITSYILKKGEVNNLIDDSLLLGSNYSFVGISLSRFYEAPSILIRSNIIATCDDNYLNIRYSPTVFESLYDLVTEILDIYGYKNIQDEIELNKSDSLFMCMSFLELYYRKKINMEEEYVKEMKIYIKNHISLMTFIKIKYTKQIIRLFIFKILSFIKNKKVLHNKGHE